MSKLTPWARYVVAVADTINSTEIARATGIGQSSVYRWLNDAAEPKPVHAAKFAQTYGDNVLRAFVAAGWLTPDEAGAPPADREPDLDAVPADRLLDALSARVRMLEHELDEARAKELAWVQLLLEEGDFYALRELPTHDEMLRQGRPKAVHRLKQLLGQPASDDNEGQA